MDLGNGGPLDEVLQAGSRWFATMTLIICPACNTRFETPAVIPPTGRKVRCSKCGNVWQATPAAEPGKPAVAPASTPPPLQRRPVPTPPPRPAQPEPRAAAASRCAATAPSAGRIGQSHAPLSRHRAETEQRTWFEHRGTCCGKDRASGEVATANVQHRRRHAAG